jgi:hypothetical protein
MIVSYMTTGEDIDYYEQLHIYYHDGQNIVCEWCDNRFNKEFRFDRTFGAITTYTSFQHVRDSLSISHQIIHDDGEP